MFLQEGMVHWEYCIILHFKIYVFYIYLIGFITFLFADFRTSVGFGLLFAGFEVEPCCSLILGSCARVCCLLVLGSSAGIFAFFALSSSYKMNRIDFSSSVKPKNSLFFGFSSKVSLVGEF